MVYTDIAVLAFLFSVIFDQFVIKARLLRRAVFWTSYAIILPFQLITNWWLTSRNIVMYSQDAIIGTRIASAPVEDLLCPNSMCDEYVDILGQKRYAEEIVIF
jgi:lycopene cyclase domain-containing protein